MRFAVVSFPYWPLTAHDVDGDAPAALIANGKVSVCTPAARQVGVIEGQRRRDALRCCPSLITLAADQRRSEQRFSQLVDALAGVVARLEVTSIGSVAFNAAEPTRYYGSEPSLLEHLRRAVAQAAENLQLPNRYDVAIGCADSRFAARIAGQSPQCANNIIPAGKSAAFLADYPIDILELPDFANLAHRLGIHTVGQFAALPHRQVITRFGYSVSNAHVIANGRDPAPLAYHAPAQLISHYRELDPVIDRVDLVAHVAQELAAELTQHLARTGVGCTGVTIRLASEHGEHDVRRWHTDFGFDTAALAERVSWQLNSWLTAPTADRPTAGLSHIEMTAHEIAVAADLQLGLWGELSDADRRAIRALDRIYGSLGEHSVLTATIVPGRTPHARAIRQPWGSRRELPVADSQPWPGHIPEPAPTLVFSQPIDIELTATDGAPVVVTTRGALSAHPARMRWANGEWREVRQWSGPWLAEANWWDTNDHRCARLQVICSPKRTVTAAGSAYLLRGTSGNWQIEAAYD